MSVGYANGIRVMSMTHTGEPGFMLYIPIEVRWCSAWDRIGSARLVWAQLVAPACLALHAGCWVCLMALMDYVPLSAES